MNLKIVSTIMRLKANNHEIKSESMSIGGFTISLDGIELSYDHSGIYYGDWNDKVEDNTPIIDWLCTNEADVYMLDGTSVEEPEYYTFTNFTEIPKITNIEEFFYESFTNTSEGIKNEFYPIYFEIKMLDVDTNEVHEIKASEEIIKKYIDEEVKIGNLKPINNTQK